MQQRKYFLRFRHAAIRRYGDKQWTASDGYIEFNPTYTVSVSVSERITAREPGDIPYLIELSNGTKFLCFVNNYGDEAPEAILSEEGEEANQKASEYNYIDCTQYARILNK